MIAQLRDLPIELTAGTGQGQIGGGTLPRSKVPSVTLDLLPRNISLVQLTARLRSGTPPVIGYISANRLKLDLRTIFPRQDSDLVTALQAALM